MGSHDGKSVIGRYINKISDRRVIIVVTSTGNEGNTDTHTQRVLTLGSPMQTIELNVAKGQNSIFMKLFIREPNTVALTIIWRSGEASCDINAKKASSVNIMYEGFKVPFIYEETIVYVRCFFLDRSSGYERIIIKATRLKSGI